MKWYSYPSKQYVLIKELGLIFDLNNECIKEKDLKRFESLKGGSMFSFTYTNNLLDLLEVGDMVEDENNDIIFVSKFTYETIQTNFIEKNFSEGIVAIWKRNGDVMRRYER